MNPPFLSLDQLSTELLLLSILLMVFSYFALRAFLKRRLLRKVKEFAALRMMRKDSMTVEELAEEMEQAFPGLRFGVSSTFGELNAGMFRCNFYLDPITGHPRTEKEEEERRKENMTMAKRASHAC